MNSEKASLLTSSKGSKFAYYGTEHGDAFSSSSKSDYRIDSPRKVSLSTLFRYATKQDKWILSIGTLFAVLHGAGMPVFALVFGQATDIYINHALYGFAQPRNHTHNSSIATTPPQISATTPLNLLIDRSMTIPSNEYAIAPPPEDLLTREEFADAMTELTLQYLYIGVVMLIASFVQVVLWEWSCERQAYRLRQEFLYQVFRQEISWYDDHQTGDLAVKLSDDLERVREGIGHKFSMIIQLVSSFVMGFGVGFVVNWQLTLVILALTPFLAGTSAYTGKILSTQSEREQQKYGKAGAIAEEVLSSIKTVASFSGEQKEIKRYESRLMEGLRLANQKYRSLAIGIGVVFFVMFCSYALAFWYGCKLLNENILTPGNIFTIFLSVLMGAFSIGNTVPFIAILGVARGAAAVVFEIIDSQPIIDPYSKAGLTPERVIGRIQFRNVSFRYPSRKQVQILDNFTVNIEPGKTVAFVGHSGVGKSTLISLILRFYDQDSGVILLDGHDLRALNLAWVRHHIGVVSQEPVLFGTTIYENICYGRDYVTPDEVVTSARMANAHDFISLLPEGYETLVGERGAQLSGGQKQRIAIARALVRDPRILLLDEATSALDSKSESIVQEALDKARAGRTTIIIAHRLSTIKDADVIYVVKDGAVAEYGNHTQLFAKGDLYYDLVTAQMSLESLEETELSADISHSDSTDESLREYDVEVEKRKRKKAKTGKRTFRVQAIPDPERARMAQEIEEINVKYPSFLKLLETNKKEWKLLFGGFLGCILAGSVMPLYAVLYSEMFQTFTKRGDALMEDALIWSLAFLGLAVLSGFGHWLRTICISTSGEYLTMRLRMLSFIKIVRQSVGWFDKETNSPARLSTRLARDAPMVKAAGGHRLATLVTCLVVIIEGLGISFYFKWQLALVIFAGFPLLIFAGYMEIHLQKAGAKKDAMLMEDCGRIATEAIQNIRTVQALSQEKLFFTKYLETLLPLYLDAHKQGLIFGLIYGISEFITFAMYTIAFGYGAYLVGIGQMEPVDIFRVFFAQAFSAFAIAQALAIVPDYSKAKLAAGLIFTLIETKSQIDPFGPQGLRPKFDGRITFSDVNFRYPSREQFLVLNGLSFDLQEGQSLAIIGPSGGGKSTIIALLERFYDVTSGQVLIDGYDIRSLNVAHLRQSIGLVTQEPVVFDCTIRENIAYGYNGDFSRQVPMNLVIEAAKSANIHTFIMGLPQAYETNVGERGTQLSGGQKQRIAIARALIRNPKILLLDEATSSLDSESEKVVQEALDKARAGRTCIIIAHRLSTIQNADYIGVINRGRIVEMGTHEQLRARKGLFYKLTKMQQFSY